MQKVIAIYIYYIHIYKKKEKKKSKLTCACSWGRWGWAHWYYFPKCPWKLLGQNRRFLTLGRRGSTKGVGPPTCPWTGASTRPCEPGLESPRNPGLLWKPTRVCNPVPWARPPLPGIKRRRFKSINNILKFEFQKERENKRNKIKN